MILQELFNGLKNMTAEKMNSDFVSEIHLKEASLCLIFMMQHLCGDSGECDHQFPGNADIFIRNSLVSYTGISNKPSPLIFILWPLLFEINFIIFFDGLHFSLSQCSKFIFFCSFR